MMNPEEIRMTEEAIAAMKEMAKAVNEMAASMEMIRCDVDALRRIQAKQTNFVCRGEEIRSQSNAAA